MVSWLKLVLDSLHPYYQSDLLDGSRWTFQAATGPSIEVGRWARGETLLRSGVAGPAAAIYADTPAFPLALTGELGVEYRLWPRLGLLLGMSYARGVPGCSIRPLSGLPGRSTGGVW